MTRCVRVKSNPAIARSIVAGDGIPGRWELPPDRTNGGSKPKRREAAIDRRRWRLTAALSEQFNDRERRRRNRRASEIGHRISGWQPAGADERYGVNGVLIPANRVPNSPGKGIRHGAHGVLSLYHQYRSARALRGKPRHYFFREELQGTGRDHRVHPRKLRRHNEMRASVSGAKVFELPRDFVRCTDHQPFGYGRVPQLRVR